MNRKKIIPGILLVFLLPFLCNFSSCSTHGGTGGSVRDTTSVSRKAVANGTGGSVRDTTSAKKKD